MHIEELEPDTLWLYYQRGYGCLIKSGLYFRQLLRPALSHVYFQRAIPLLKEYARCTHSALDLPPGFGAQMEACPLSPRDLLHLDYAICLGYSEMAHPNADLDTASSVMDWPGPPGHSGVFIAADAPFQALNEELRAEFGLDDEDDTDEFEQNDEDDDGEPEPPYDL